MVGNIVGNVITKHSLVGNDVGMPDGGTVGASVTVGAGVRVDVDVEVDVGTAGVGMGVGTCVSVGMGVGMCVGRNEGAIDFVVVDVDVDVVGTRSSSVGMLVLVGSYVWVVGR